MGGPGDAILSEPGRQVTTEDTVERNNREAEKNATKASLNLQSSAGATPAVPASKDLSSRQGPHQQTGCCMLGIKQSLNVHD